MRFPIIIQKNCCILNDKDTNKLLNSNTKDRQLYLTDYKLQIDSLITKQKVSEVFINQTDTKNLKLQAPIKIPGKKGPGSSISISSTNANIYLSQGCFTLPNFLRISTADAKHLQLKQNQILQMEIPYKNIQIPNIKVYIKDSFSPELILTPDFTQEHGIKNPDRAQILIERSEAY